MKAKSLFIVLGIAAVLCVVALRTQSSARREMERERGYVQVTERTVDGFSEWHSRPIPLVVDPTEPGQHVYWFASAYADPSRPGFVVTFTNAGSPRETWELDIKQPVGILVDGRRYELKLHQTVGGADGRSVRGVRFSVPRSILEAVAGSKSAQVEFSWRRHELGERGLANCRELLRRAAGAAKR